MKVVVAGAGAWGTAFTRVLVDRGHEVTLAARDPEQARAISESGRNPRYLSDVALDGVAGATLPEAPFGDAELAVLAVPSRAYAEVVAGIPADVPVLSLTKGLDPATGDRLSTLLGGRSAAVLSGPNFAEEIGHGLPAATVIASEDVEFAERLQEELNSLIFRVYVNSDLVGVELAGAAKNVIALAAGGVEGLGLGDSAKAGIVTRGLAEMSRLGEASGGRAETFSGMAGVGDLIATCWSHHGRNRRAGELIAKGAAPEEAAAAIGTVEGLTTAPVMRTLSHRVGVEMPITNAVCDILEGSSLQDLIARLMGRRPIAE
jgi:glycerol-3-phosphate dehydrogenase (NAD(P)+)